MTEKLRASVALLDIEGTLGSFAFVHDVLFPFAEERMDAYVSAHQDDPRVRAILDEAATLAGVDVHDLDAILRALHVWSREDAKITPLKALQGFIWAEGFEQNGLHGHLYDDSVAALRRFHDAGVTLYIYSSGSIGAQKLLFGHSVAGNLLNLFSGFYDTTIGGKRERSSYEKIARDIGASPEAIVFFSDNIRELDAARAAGLQTIHVARPEDGTEAASTHPVVTSFDGIDIKR